ncbi:MAG: hypothetical protein JWM59_1185 [Verrucomicrobiales bacterium]|nr:hypothetical protein [Verrucomicrobiales bacterium]
MNSNTVEPAASRLSSEFESAPAFGSGIMSAGQERTFVMLAHLFPLIIWFWKRRESPAVDAHGKEALNFGITAMICLPSVMLLAGFLPSVITFFLSLGVGLACLGVPTLMIHAMLLAREGKLSRYPINFRLIK